MAKYIVLLGPPGAGKGTQAEILSEKLNLAHISSGDLFREHLKKQTELGKLAQSFMNRGELVPDDVTIAMVSERLSQPDCVNGAVLDGFPRTPAQADALAEILKKFNGKVQIVPMIAVAPDILVKRLSGRWTCRKEGHVFHQEFNPPKTAGVCDIDGSELYQREDDQPATVEKRILVFMEQTTPLIEYYIKQHLLVRIDGTQPIQVVTEQLLKVIKSGEQK
jgi:adenylate kinase